MIKNSFKLWFGRWFSFGSHLPSLTEPVLWFPFAVSVGVFTTVASVYFRQVQDQFCHLVVARESTDLNAGVQLHLVPYFAVISGVCQMF